MQFDLPRLEKFLWTLVRSRNRSAATVPYCITTLCTIGHWVDASSEALSARRRLRKQTRTYFERVQKHFGLFDGLPPLATSRLLLRVEQAHFQRMCVCEADVGGSEIADLRASLQRAAPPLILIKARLELTLASMPHKRQKRSVRLDTQKAM